MSPSYHFCAMGGMSMSSSGGGGGGGGGRSAALHRGEDYFYDGILPVHIDNDASGDASGDSSGDSSESNDMEGMGHESHGSHSMGGTVMYMDGFHWALYPYVATFFSHGPLPPPPRFELGQHLEPHLEPHQEAYREQHRVALQAAAHEPVRALPPCLNYLHSSWTLTTPAKFLLAMSCTFFVGALVEACGVWRARLLRRRKRLRHEARLKRRGDAPPPSRSPRPPRLHDGLPDPDDGDMSSVTMTTPSPATPSSRHCRHVRRLRRAFVPRCLRLQCSRACSALGSALSTALGCAICSKAGSTACFLRRSSNDHWDEQQQHLGKMIKRYHFLATCLHALRAWLAYILMLAVMTYALEFLLCAVMGMVVGRYWFVDLDDEGGGATGVIVGNGTRAALSSTPSNHSDGGIHMQSKQPGSLLDGYEQGSWRGIGNSDNIGGTAGDPCCGLDDEDYENYIDQEIGYPLGNNRNDEPSDYFGSEAESSNQSSLTTHESMQIHEPLLATSSMASTNELLPTNVGVFRRGNATESSNAAEISGGNIDADNSGLQRESFL